MTFSTCAAKVRIATPFTDHMVIQRDTKAPMWGEAQPGEIVTVTIAGKKYPATTDASGRWQVLLDAMPANSEPMTVEIAGKENKLELDNVVVGDVWIVAG